ncbi:F0F1 ATP synthase subunit A [Runella limosa]|uniref:F0F1 ATP synthase subunit A n=1 Tax=Runella limosa TaxID=370978 RepID=UPI0004175E4A
MKHISIRLFVLFLFLAAIVSPQVMAEEPHKHGEKEKFNAGEMIMHHVADGHEWHFATIGHTHISIPLPVIIYDESKGFKVFSSSHFYHSEDGTYEGYKLEHEHITALDGSHVKDFSITKNVASLILSFILLLTIFLTVAKSYKERTGKSPKGLQSVLEPIIIFIRDEVAKSNIGEKHYRRFTPYLLTLFFFIWINNLLGLLPGGANLTGNIAVTMTLAVITFIVVNFNGKSTYWTHIFAMPGVPKWMLIILTPVEIVGLFMKPFSLMVRLFANITAGHIILLSFLSMIFIFESLAVSPAVAIFSTFINLIELLVAALQAYIFTVLTASYIGAAVEEHHH